MSAGSTVQDLYLGIDLGTSGCRTIVINAQAEVVANLAYDWPAEIQTAHTWEQGVNSLLAKLADKVALHTIKGICVDGTSGTVMLTEMGRPQEPVLMYNDARAGLRAQELAGIAPAGHPVLSPTSGLAKVLWLIKNNRIATLDGIFHQADWLTNILREYDYEESEKYHRHVHYTDYNNALKTGFDPVEKKWPDWIKQLHIPAEWLPFVVAPGTDIGTISRDYVEQYGFSPETRILAGTTDSTAAVMATGASQPGEAVTSLGSTMVLKVLCDKPINDANAGIYSQPYGDLWLVGGASNSGGRVLREFFTDEEMRTMMSELDFSKPTGLDYYPLPAKGERFPFNDPDKQPVLTPRPDNQLHFFQAMLEGMAKIEKTGYEKLAEAGAPYPVSVCTVGGGAINQAWTEMRGKLLNVPMLQPLHTEAAYGVALLVRNKLQQTGLTT